MKRNKPKYIVKGRIKELNYSTNYKLLRYDSPHFLPLEEVCIYKEPRNREYVLCENRLSVRGKHRSGMFKAKRTNIRFIENLHLQEIQNPSYKTLDFIEKNNILYFEEGSLNHSHVMDILNHIEKQEYPTIVKEDINDEQFLKAQEFVLELQHLIKKEAYEKIINQFIAFPLLSHRYENKKKIKEKIDIEFLRNNIRRIFTQDTKNQIMITDINTIFPSERVMVIGSLRVEISKNYAFKINTIETLNEYTDGG